VADPLEAAQFDLPCCSHAVLVLFLLNIMEKLQTQILSVAKDGISYKWDVKPASQTYVCG